VETNADFISVSVGGRNAADAAMNQPGAYLVSSKYIERLPGLLEQLRGGLIVSCQAEMGEPLYGSAHMAVMAAAAALGGAVGIRANAPEDIAAIRRMVTLPIIGIYKLDIPGYTVRITPTLESATAVARAGADIIAIDCTSRPHPESFHRDEHIRRIHEQTNLAVMADISTYEEGLAAQVAGADLVATTLSGYTGDSPNVEGPDFDLLHRLASTLQIPVIAEGRIATPAQAAEAISLGAFAVVVGSAITRPALITASFVKAMAQQ
jgi:N-acylglucosamine-6-phosphate 2-epimerase